jgi:hypothetical protein
MVQQHEFVLRLSIVASSRQPCKTEKDSYQIYHFTVCVSHHNFAFLFFIYHFTSTFAHILRAHLNTVLPLLNVPYLIKLFLLQK